MNSYFIWLLSFTFVLLTPVTHAAPFQTGMISAEYHDPATNRTLQTRIFFPTTGNTQRDRIDANGVFKGIAVYHDSPLAKGPFPLILLAHGSGGNNGNQGYLAKALATSGYIVAAANHPDSTTGNVNAKEGMKAWKQTQDLSFLISALLKDNRFKTSINSEQIGVIGHSKGGYSALALAGVRVSKSAFVSLCQTKPSDPNCAFLLFFGADPANLDKLAFEDDYSDPRIKFAVALDAGYQPMMTRQSLAAITTPVLWMAVEYYSPAHKMINLDKPENFAHIPQSVGHYTKLNDASHFAFLSECTEMASVILAEDGEGFICEDGQRTRADIHREVIDRIQQFIEQTLSAADGV